MLGGITARGEVVVVQRGSGGGGTARERKPWGGPQCALKTEGLWRVGPRGVPPKGELGARARHTPGHYGLAAVARDYRN